MYSPFECITPTPARATPSQTPGRSIRMGTQPCRRLSTVINSLNDVGCADSSEHARDLMNILRYYKDKNFDTAIAYVQILLFVT